ncbi:DUF998 domain-containing protein [Corynebacterium falsenii]|uniref:DUF998 domain-containing protein n=1 Tax=Corynebacterium falsenii TaxID=108486 RepID=A0A418QA40_9CORY|nr:DUF998 domain-containing protein [Corynebacterium falsenii]RIX36858.1 DUF998 domain-containing protein [Corynebacterium falsenii]
MTARKTAGILAVLSGLIYFIGQALATVQWQGSYSLQYNLIGDLGVSQCDLYQNSYGSRYICSPGHLWFNGGLVIAAILMVAVGAVLIAQRLARLAGASLILAGIAAAVAGFIPLNVNETVHNTAALVQGFFLIVATGAAIAKTIQDKAGVVASKDKKKYVAEHRPILPGGLLTTSMVLLVLAIGGPLLALLVGEWQGVVDRMLFDILMIWMVVLGVGLYQTKLRPTTNAARMRRADRNAERDAAIINASQQHAAKDNRDRGAHGAE